MHGITVNYQFFAKGETLYTNKVRLDVTTDEHAVGIDAIELVGKPGN